MTGFIVNLFFIDDHFFGFGDCHFGSVMEIIYTGFYSSSFDEYWFPSKFLSSIFIFIYKLIISDGCRVGWMVQMLTIPNTEQLFEVIYFGYSLFEIGENRLTTKLLFGVCVYKYLNIRCFYLKMIWKFVHFRFINVCLMLCSSFYSWLYCQF